MQSKILAEFARELRLSVAQLDYSRSFIALGGHSLAALRLVAACRRLGYSLTVGELLDNRPLLDVLSRLPLSPPSSHEEGQDVVRRTSYDILKDSVVNITINDIAPSSPSDEDLPSPTVDTEIITAASSVPCVPIPEMQLSLIRSSYAKPGHNILAYQQMCNAAELPPLRAAWQHVIEAEEIFAKSFAIEDGRGYLTDSNANSIKWTDILVHDQATFTAEIMAKPRFNDVDFEFRTITWAEEQKACLLWHVHHAYVDGFSMTLLLDKVTRCIAGLPLQRGPSYASVVRERNLLIEQREEEARAYWRSQKDALDTATSELQLCSSHDLGEADTFWNGLATFAVNIPSTKLDQYAHQHHVTTASIYYAAWALVLSTVCDSDHIIFGAVMSGRSLPVAGILEVVGSLVNTLPMAISVDANENTSSFVWRVFQQLVALTAFDWSESEHGCLRQFSSVLALQFNTSTTTISAPQIRSMPSSRMNSEIPLSVTIETDGTIHIQYSRKYDKRHIEKIGSYFTSTIESLTKDDYSVGMCLDGMLSIPDKQTLFQYGNCLSGLTTRTSIHDDLVSLMKRAARQNPTVCAVTLGESMMTYRELDQKSNCVAAHLGMYVQHGDIVCVHAEQSLNWIIAIYGILKAGAVYCPLNSKLDPDLRSSMFDASTADIYLTASTGETRWRPKRSRYCWAVEDLLQRELFEDEESGSPHNLCPEANAYLCFTSGSSGKPKGVLCTHQGLVAFQRDREVRLLAQPGIKVGQIMSVSFDGSIHEIFSALSYGATLVLPSPKDPFAHLHEVDTCILTPSLAATLDAADYPNLRAAYLVGEQVSQVVNDHWSARTAVYNMYGPTEATCGATIKRLVPGEKVTIGCPNPTSRIYILDRQRRLAPPGLVGQIYLAGVQVSNGYLGQPQLTAERFFADCVCRGLGEQMYATGDMGYWTGTGELVCLGRNDRQVKLRGFRLDLDDLEARISNLPGITGAAVTRYEDDLIAMVQPRNLSLGDCKRRMASVLPIHAVPRYCITVDQFPITAAGKLDYKAIVKSVQEGGLHEPPREMSATEQQVAQVWSDILGTKATEITVDSSFIGLGGNSLLQLRLASRLSKAFACSVPLTLVIGAQTLYDLSAKIDELCTCQAQQAVYSLTPTQEDRVSRMEAEWSAKYTCDSTTTAFNVSFLCRLSPSIDRHRLADSWNTVLRHHSVLRSRYRPAGIRFKRIYSEGAPVAQSVTACDVFSEINRPFIISEDDLLRVTITPETLVVTASHIVCDLTAMQTLLSQVREVYQGGSIQSSPPEYMAADAWKRVASLTDLSFWATYLQDAPRPTRRRASYAGSSRVVMLPSDTAQTLDNFCQTSPFSHHQLALAAVALALQSQSNKIDLVLGGPFLNRWSEADMHTVGLFLEPIPFRIRFHPENTSDETCDAEAFLQSVRCSSQTALTHAIPWQQLLCHLGITPDFPNHPLFEVMVTFHTREHALRFGLEGAEELYTWAQGAKFGLMCEFTALPNEEILLRLEYDDSIWCEEEIARVETAIIRGLEMLVRNARYDDMVTTLRTAEPDSTLRRKDMFLLPLRKA
ncbi:non-ribosomal peptide synthetase [Penicillium chermesinum]|uniref:Non-ribosomal peptide synthetase n=1 Tax=Penicillium chermesinum TaxID=63820 RepID=A0A9W9TYL8_9EURO|nr:non-ribosomal peptide synthetase [Penicillium chermesinum]KAJ5249273.1 non-ribosomal peptide synthetase [Penicillium chermesinum]KAJ6151362.1 non-ribosomal peptide synthetase [Penicillium chermesinum]